jgi:uncharacterized protein (DUF433 family)
MNEPITIVDCGRGLQLSTSRITVQDLVPYFQDNCADEEIMRWIPDLTPAEIAVVRRYYAEHKAALDEQDRRILERTEEAIRLQRLRFPEPEGTIEERRSRLRKLLNEKLHRANGEGNSG